MAFHIMTLDIAVFFFIELDNALTLNILSYDNLRLFANGKLGIAYY